MSDVLGKVIAGLLIASMLAGSALLLLLLLAMIGKVLAM